MVEAAQRKLDEDLLCCADASEGDEVVRVHLVEVVLAIGAQIGGLDLPHVVAVEVVAERDGVVNEVLDKQERGRHV